MKKVKCFNCNQCGHFAKDCTHPKQERKSSSQKLTNVTSEIPQLFVATLVVSNNERDNWCLDSSATHCITPNKHWFADYMKLNKFEKMYLGDNIYFHVKWRGSMKVHLPNGEIRCIEAVLQV
jgi:hypothetical protein